MTKKISKNYISNGGFKKIQQEFEKLNLERKEVVLLVQWAASNGDRSENADYLYGKRRLREIDSRLRFLSKRLEHMEIVNYHEFIESQEERVRFGAKVEIADEDGAVKHYIIVGVDEVNIHKNQISVESPIGKNLLEKTTGDSVELHTPGGKKSFEIVSVVYVKWDEDINF